MKRILITAFAIVAAAMPIVAQEAGAVPASEPRFDVTPQWSTTTTLWQSGTYVYDEAGHVMEIGDDRYRYDTIGRLNYATARTPDNTGNLQTFKYDRYGNLTVTDITTANGVTREAYGVDAGTNQIDAACAAPYSICYGAVYDAAGRQSGRYNAGEYRWDPLGMLKEVNSMRHEQYLYDAADERVAVIHYVGSTETSRRYTLRGPDNKVAREMTFTVASSTWSVTRDYVYRPGGVIAAFSGTGGTPDRHYHLDHLRSTRLVTDGDGYKVAIHTYWPFGREADGSERDHERMKFTGHERDSSGGTPGFDLDYMHARHYDMNQKRFLSMDPAGASRHNPQTWNRYTYVLNNPLKYTDPDGRVTRDEVMRRAAWYEQPVTNFVQFSVSFGFKRGFSVGPIKMERSAKVEYNFTTDKLSATIAAKGATAGGRMKYSVDGFQGEGNFGPAKLRVDKDGARIGLGTDDNFVAAKTKHASGFSGGELSVSTGNIGAELTNETLKLEGGAYGVTGSVEFAWAKFLDTLKSDFWSFVNDKFAQGLAASVTQEELEQERDQKK